jgi:uncharacterized membrane protein
MSQSNSSVIPVAKATLIGGAVFLIPAFLVVFVLAKLFGILNSLTSAVGSGLGIESALGGLALDLFAILALALVCFLAGLVAQRSAARRLRSKLDRVLLASFPGYAFVKGLAETIHQSEGMSSTLVPVLVAFDEYSQVAFETDRSSEGTVAVYLPGAPNPWSGNVMFVTEDRVKKLAISVTDALQILRTLGKGSGGIAKAYRVHSETHS